MDTAILRSAHMLVVDLDGSLIRSDMLFESFWSAFSARWTAPLQVIGALARGRAALKARLAELASVDAATLPYNEGVVDYIRNWREGGGQVALVTASNVTYAKDIAAHLGLFDEVHGSDAVHNLKGANKAKFLEKRFGVGNYDYIGDAEADLPVWANARKAIVVDGPRALVRQITTQGGEVAEITDPTPALRPAIKAMRPHQWLKNLLVFLPLLMAHEFTSVNVIRSVMAFIAFSLVASSVYVLNDLLDLASDRAHPRKRNRPFASGALPLSAGTWMVPALLFMGAMFAVPLGADFLFVMAGYYVVTTAYSLYLKRQLIIDVCTLAVLYAIRIIAGGAATGIPLSVWLLAFSVFFFFSLAAVKRQAELVDGAASGKTKAHGRGYHVDDTPLVAAMAAASGYVSVMVLALYVNSETVRELYAAPTLLWGVCLVLLYWVSRTVMLAHRGQMHDDPVVYAVKDRVSQICALIILGIAAAATML
ncbi:UbiA family prenyltransferase [Actibacterium mucosum]|nr:UbiA family prenyltransferase [Actibacterium mucosum]